MGAGLFLHLEGGRLDWKSKYDENTMTKNNKEGEKTKSTLNLICIISLQQNTNYQLQYMTGFVIT